MSVDTNCTHHSNALELVYHLQFSKPLCFSWIKIRILFYMFSTRIPEYNEQVIGLSTYYGTRKLLFSLSVRKGNLGISNTRAPWHSFLIFNLPMLGLLSSIAQGCKVFENHLNPVMLVLIGKLSLSTLRWVPIVSFCIDQLIHQQHKG